MTVLTSGDSDIGRAVAVRARLGLALAMIDEYAPRLGARMRRDVAVIHIWRTGGTAYNPYAQMIMIDIGYAMAGQVEDLALALVHEATHARQFAMGMPKRRTRTVEARLEAHAVAESIAFAERLPPGPWRKPSLADLQTEWWTTEQRYARLMSAAKESGISVGRVRIAAAILRVIGLAR